MHTLGNLTLTGYNSEYSDRPFTEKRDMKGGFRESPLRLNKELGSLDHWDKDSIHRRADRLAKQAVKVWAQPALAADVLKTYSPKGKQPADYTLSDHRYLSENGRVRELFNALHSEILALDPCVSEEILKRYIAYKAETNFVCVVPLKGNLRLYMALRFHELNDPKKLAWDVTNIGHLGTGDVALDLGEPDKLRYVMGLVRQAYEKQMGNGEAMHN